MNSINRAKLARYWKPVDRQQHLHSDQASNTSPLDLQMTTKMISSILLPLLWSATMAHAIPTVPQQPESVLLPGPSLTIPVRANPDHVPDGPAALVAAYAKWNMPVPEPLANHMLTRRAGYSCKLTLFLLIIFLLAVVLNEKKKANSNAHAQPPL